VRCFGVWVDDRHVELAQQLVLDRRLVGGKRRRHLLRQRRPVDLVTRHVRDEEAAAAPEVEKRLREPCFPEGRNVDRSADPQQARVPVEDQGVFAVIVGEPRDHGLTAVGLDGKGTKVDVEISAAQCVEICHRVPARVRTQRRRATRVRTDHHRADPGAHRRSVPGVVVGLAGGEDGPAVELRRHEDILEMPESGEAEMDAHVRGAAQAGDRPATRGDGALDDGWAGLARVVRADRRAAGAEQKHGQRSRAPRRRRRCRRRRLLGVVVVATLAGIGGCSQGSVAPVAPRAPVSLPNPAGPVEFSEHTFSLRNGWIRGTLLVPAGASSASPRGVVINPLLDPARLLERGLVVARYRPHWGSLPHRPQPGKPDRDRSDDQTVGVWLLASPSPHVIGKSYFHLIWAEGRSAGSVVEYLAGLDFVDTAKIGMAGISTNGFKVYAALLADVRLRAAVIVGACGDYHAFLRDSPVALGGATLDLEPEYERWLQEREPIRNGERLVGSSLMLVNGGRDHVIPSVCAGDTASVLAAAYERVGAAERFRYFWFEDATHNDLVERAAPEILEWWSRWLE
jgi:hypothetical protein